MIDPNRVTEAVKEFMQNPTWKEIFMNAPGGAMERLAISFYFSKFHDEFKPEDFDEYRSLREEYEKSMTEEDLQYLIDNSDKENAIKHYQDLLNKLKGGGGQPTGKIRFEKDTGNEEHKQGDEQEQQQTQEGEGTEQTENADNGATEAPAENGNAQEQEKQQPLFEKESVTLSEEQKKQEGQTA